MKNRRVKRLLSIVLCIMLVMSNIAYADTSSTELAKYPDIVGNKYEVQIREWIANGFIKGYPDGSFKPGNQITRSEFMALVNRAYGFTETMEISYSDVTKSQWYYNDAAKAIKAGFIQGANGKLMPLDNISRQEMATIISRLTKNEKAAADDAMISSLSDNKDIPTWSKAAISTALKNKFFDGFVDKTFKPTEKISRLEAVVALDRAFKSMYKGVYTTQGVYGPEAGTQTLDGDVVVISPEVTLKNITINGDLILRETIGEGNVYLDNVVVLGETIVKGGGANSIVIKNSTLGKIIVIKEGNTVRIVATGTTTIDTVDIGANAELEEFELTGAGFNDVIVLDDIPVGANVIFEGNFGDVQIDSANINVAVQSGTLNSLTLAAAAVNTNINLGQQAAVTTMTLDAASNVTGTGTIGTANINATGTVMQQTPTTVVTAPNVIAQVGGQPATAPTAPVPSSGGGGGGGGGLRNIEIEFNNSLVVVGYSDHNPDIKKLNPADATLTYASSDATIVAINRTSGKMTGVKAGEATITVTATKSGYRT
ncbi:MAG: S-layer domain protein, partial [Clostridia bacterium]|nr:S-layer domain protein [Clostridia bacterium]